MALLLLTTGWRLLLLVPGRLYCACAVRIKMAYNDERLLQLDENLSLMLRTTHKNRPERDLSHPVWSFYTRTDTDSEGENGDTESDDEESAVPHETTESPTISSPLPSPSYHSPIGSPVEPPRGSPSPQQQNEQQSEPQQEQNPQPQHSKSKTLPPQAGVTEVWSTSEEEISEDDEVTTPKSRLPERPSPFKRRHRKSLINETASPKQFPLQSGAGGRRSLFSRADVKKLVAGINKEYTYKGSRRDWNKLRLKHDLEHISCMSLKDKWRNLIKYEHVKQNPDGQWILLMD